MEIIKFNNFINEVETFCTKNKAFVDVSEIKEFSNEILHISDVYQQDLGKEYAFLANKINTEMEICLSDSKIENINIEIDALVKQKAITNEEGRILKDLRRWRNEISHKSVENKNLP